MKTPFLVLKIIGSLFLAGILVLGYLVYSFFNPPVEAVEQFTCGGTEVSFYSQEFSGIDMTSFRTGFFAKKGQWGKNHKLQQINHFVPVEEFRNGFENTFDFSTSITNTGSEIKMQPDDYEVKYVLYVDPEIFTKEEFINISKCLKKFPKRYPYGDGGMYSTSLPEYVLFRAFPRSHFEVNTEINCGDDKYAVVVDDRITIAPLHAQERQWRELNETDKLDHHIPTIFYDQNSSAFVGYFDEEGTFFDRSEGFNASDRASPLAQMVFQEGLELLSQCKFKNGENAFDI